MKALLLAVATGALAAGPGLPMQPAGVVTPPAGRAYCYEAGYCVVGARDLQANQQAVAVMGAALVDAGHRIEALERDYDELAKSKRCAVLTPDRRS